MRYSLITLCLNKLACTQRCLMSLLRHSVVDAPWELVAVDNGSTDGTGEWLEHKLVAVGREAGVPVRVLRSAVNIGCSTARNRAIDAASGEFLVFIDNDVTPRTRCWLPALRASLLADARAGMIGPKMVYPTPPYAIQCAGVGISRRGHVCFLGRGEAADDPRFNFRRPVQCLISACLMVRAELVRAHGGFDEIFNPVQFEDFDLCYRLRELGWLAVYEPAVEMYHYESVTTQGTSTMCNAAVVVRNGLIFQKRWLHMFERESGPAESECRWRRTPVSPLESIADPPLL